jgi:hypothetical protein
MDAAGVWRGASAAVCIGAAACGAMTGLDAIPASATDASHDTAKGGVSDAAGDEARGRADTGAVDAGICVDVVQDFKRPPPTDIFVLLDASGTMNCEASNLWCVVPRRVPRMVTRWMAATNTLRTMVNAPTQPDRRYGIGLFPHANFGCSSSAYEEPLVPIGPLPANVSPIEAALANVQPAGSAPTNAALAGALAYVGRYIVDNEGRRNAVVLLMTDAVQNACEPLPSAAAAALTAFHALPPVRTYVVNIAFPGALDPVALAGSGGAVHEIPFSDDLPAKLDTYLEGISDQLTCNYLLASNADKGIDYTTTTVLVTVGANGTPVPVARVESAAMCDPTGGWYYDRSPPAMPSQVTLCPQTCDLLKRADEGRVRVFASCDAG